MTTTTTTTDRQSEASQLVPHDQGRTQVRIEEKKRNQHGTSFFLPIFLGRFGVFELGGRVEVPTVL